MRTQMRRRNGRSRRVMVGLLLALAASGWATPAGPAIAPGDPETGPTYQWAVPVELPDGKATTALVWVPPQAERIRGVLIGRMPALTADRAVRRACAAEKLAIIDVGIDAIFNYKTGRGPEMFLAALKAAAEATGYREIEMAPFFCLEVDCPKTISSASPSSLPWRMSAAMAGGRKKAAVRPLPVCCRSITAIQAKAVICWLHSSTPPSMPTP